MIYKVSVHVFPDGEVKFDHIHHTKLTTKQYHEYVKDVFIEYQNCMGQDIEEAIDTFSSQPFPNVEKWLIKCGYDLENGFKYDSGK